MNKYSTSTPEPSPNDALTGAVHRIHKAVHDIYPKIDGSAGALQTILKSLTDAEASEVGDESGEKELPFDFLAAAKFKVHNVHHSTCIEAKRQATVGLGHSNSAVAETLDPLCRVSWQTTMTQLAEDYFQVGNAYLEVVRDSVGGRITGLHHVAACDVRIVIEDDRGVNQHFVVKGRGLARSGRHEVKMAAFGDGEDFARRHNASGKVSEIIHFPEPSALSRWYGFPSWLAAAAPVELVQALHQHQFDFHVNRGVPEFVMFLLGAKADKKTWKDLTTAFNSYVGVGNSHKSSIFNLPDPNMTVQLERLAMEGIANGTFFRDMSETLAVTIVSAHRVPPSIAGILIPGKMGAANESSNAIMTFQALVVGPAQHHFETVLGCSLGRDGVGVEGLGRDDFELNTIVAELSESMKLMNTMDTMGRMRDELPDAAAEGRDLEEGVQRSVRKSETMLLAEALIAAAASHEGARHVQHDDAAGMTSG